MSKLTIWEAIRKGAEEFPLQSGCYISFQNNLPVAVCALGAMFAAVTDVPQEKWIDLYGTEIVDTIENHVIIDQWTRGRIVEQVDKFYMTFEEIAEYWESRA